jgi:hypothetical protein
LRPRQSAIASASGHGGIERHAALGKAALIAATASIVLAMRRPSA